MAASRGSGGRGGRVLAAMAAVCCVGLLLLLAPAVSASVVNVAVEAPDESEPAPVSSPKEEPVVVEVEKPPQEPAGGEAEQGCAAPQEEDPWAQYYRPALTFFDDFLDTPFLSFPRRHHARTTAPSRASFLPARLHRPFVDFWELGDLGASVLQTIGGEKTRRWVDSAALRPVASDDESVTYAVKLAGVPRENVAVSVDSEGLLVVEASYKDEPAAPADAEGKQAKPSEQFTYFAQRQLPFGVDAAEVKAEYKDGLLKVRVPQPTKGTSHKVTLS